MTTITPTRIRQNLNVTYDLIYNNVACTQYIEVNDPAIPAGEQNHGYSIRGTYRYVAGLVALYDHAVTVSDSAPGANVYANIGSISVGGAATARGLYYRVRSLPSHQGVACGAILAVNGLDGQAHETMGLALNVESNNSHSFFLHMGNVEGAPCGYGINMNASVRLRHYFIQWQKRPDATAGFLNLQDAATGRSLFEVNGSGWMKVSRLNIPAGPPPQPEEGDIWREASTIKVFVGGRVRRVSLAAV